MAARDLSSGSAAVEGETPTATGTPNGVAVADPGPDQPGVADEVLPRWPGTFRRSSAAKRAHLFAVVSWGAAATTWLAKALNSHCDIFCVHAAKTPLMEFEPRIRLDGVDYAAFLLQTAKDYQVVGDIHGFSRYDIGALEETFGAGFSSGVLVREPVDRLLSQLAHFRSSPDRRLWDISYIDPVIEQAGLVLPGSNPDARLFVHAVNMLNAIGDERKVGPIYKSEDVTSRPDAFAELVQHVGGGRIEPDAEWVEAVLGLARTNVHKRGQEPELTEWQLEVIEKIVWPESWDLYEELGYERPSSIA